MNKWTFGWMAALSVIAGSVLAQEDAARRASAEELLTVMKTPEMIGKSFDGMKQMLPGQMKQLVGGMGETNMSAEVNAQMQKMMDVMAEEFSWAKVKDDFITLYAQTFTEEEMKGIIAFYKSPAGQVFIDKQPELMKRSMEFSQKVMMRVMPRLKAMAEEIKPKQAQPAKPAAPPAAKDQ